MGWAHPKFCDTVILNKWAFLVPNVTCTWTKVQLVSWSGVRKLSSCPSFRWSEIEIEENLYAHVSECVYLYVFVGTCMYLSVFEDI